MTPAYLLKVAGLLLLGSAGSTGANSPGGPISSASVHISVSVATKYSLMSDASFDALEPGGAHDQGSLCMATNGRATLLPVMLVRPAARGASLSPTGKEVSRQIAWCDVPGGVPALQSPTAASGERLLLLIRPE